jgi:hypothetical protein
MDCSENTAKQHLKASDPKRLIGVLTVAEVVSPQGHGWAIICPELASGMMVRKNEGGTRGTFGGVPEEM